MQPHRQLTSRELIVQYAHILQQDLFPKLEETVGPLSPQLRLLASVIPLLPLAKLLNCRRSHTGRPAKDRLALATAFLAKAILNLATTRDLMDRLRVDSALRLFCGWYSVETLPHESKFSRVFAEFCKRLVSTTCKTRSKAAKNPLTAMLGSQEWAAKVR